MQYCRKYNNRFWEDTKLTFDDKSRDRKYLASNGNGFTGTLRNSDNACMCSYSQCDEKNRRARANYTTYNIQYQIVYERYFAMSDLYITRDERKKLGYLRRDEVIEYEGLCASRKRRFNQDDCLDGLDSNDKVITIKGDQWDKVLARERG